MEGRKIERPTTRSIALILSVATLMAAMGRHSAVAQSSCSSALATLTPCLSYVTGNNNVPTRGCCSSLASVVKNDAPCLCQLLTANSPSVNRTRALALPGECNVTTPPISQCQGSGTPTSPSATGSGNPTKQTKTSSNPTETNAALGNFISSIVNVVAGVVLAAILS